MRVFVNLPQDDDGIAELKARVADFHATLLIEKIKRLNISNKEKDKILKEVLNKLKEKSKTTSPAPF